LDLHVVLPYGRALGRRGEPVTSLARTLVCDRAQGAQGGHCYDRRAGNLSV
jgi:hypothetical protein